MFFYSNHRFVYRVFMHFPLSWDLRPQLMAVSGQPCPYQTTQVGFSLKLVDPQTWTRYTTNERGCFFCDYVNLSWSPFNFACFLYPWNPWSWPQHPMDPSCVTRLRNLFWVPFDAGGIHRSPGQIRSDLSRRSLHGLPMAGTHTPSWRCELGVLWKQKKAKYQGFREGGLFSFDWTHIEKIHNKFMMGIYIYNSSATVNMSAFILVLQFWETSVISVGPFGRDIAFA